MKDATTYARKFASLVKKLRQAYEPEPVEPVDPVTQVILGFLEWESTRKKSIEAYRRVMSVMVDNNDVRVTHDHDLVALIGPDYPRVTERVARLRDVLQEVFRREHATNLNSLGKCSKKQVRAYLDTLPGMTPYVSAQVLLLCFDAHAIPVDETLADLLKQQAVVDPDASLEEIAAFIERQVKAGQGHDTHQLLRAWVDAGTRRVKVVTAGARKKAAKRTSKRTTRSTAKATTRQKKTGKSSTRKRTTKKVTTKSVARKK